MTDLPARTGVLVVGTGFAGLGTAIALRRSGRTDVVVIERADDVGGTWRDNSYPGCACDVPSHLYSFSFAPNPGWSRAFSPQPEIEAYLQRTAREHGVRPHFGTELLDARWDDDAWVVQTSRGTIRADALVLGTGGLSEPAVPDVPGLADFTGTLFHSATWDHDHDLTGERVAVIGTGASAIQFVPHVQRRAGSLTLFQRTAPWVMPRRDRAISAAERALFRALPLAQKLNRASIWAMRESWLVGFTKRPGIMRVAEAIARRHLHGAVKDPALRAALTPTYTLGCKRVLLSNEYYPALAQDNVSVVTEAIARVEADAVVTADGVRHEVDTIVLGTGFQVTDPPIAHRVRGRTGSTLAQVWREQGMAAHHGLTMAGFPNLFFLVGPNTGLGHTSIVVMIEAQLRYLVSALDQMRDRGVQVIEPRQDAQDRWNDRVQADLQDTVWNTGGCSSWYLDRNGRNTTLWPTFTSTYRKEVAVCDLDQYVLTPAREQVAA